MSERATSQSTERCARGRERERPGGKWRFEIEERCESPHGFTGCHNPASPSPRGWRFRSRDAKHNARPRYGKSANREAILGRRKRRRDLDSTVRESNENWFASKIDFRFRFGFHAKRSLGGELRFRSWSFSVRRSRTRNRSSG